MTQFAGIDVGQGHTYSCVLDIESRTFHYPEQQLSLSATISWLQSFKKLKGACIDGPPNPNTGALAQRLPLQTIHNTDRRLTEFQIGIGGCYSTRAIPPQQGASNYWMQSAFDLFHHIEANFEWGIDKGGANGQLIETHPTYAFKALLGCNRNEIDGIQRLRLDPQSTLRRKHSWEGRAQRIELLTALCGEIGLEVPDNILQKWNQRIDWVDAAICAFMSYWHHAIRQQLESPGDPVEGAIYLRIPQKPHAVNAHDVGAIRVDRGPLRTAVPVLPLDGIPTPANAIILRLGDTAQLTQLDTIDTLLSSDDLEEFWFPCGSNANFNLSKNLNLLGGRLYLSWGGNLRVRVRISDVRKGDNPLPYPGDSKNPWPMTECLSWLRISEATEILTDQFRVKQSGVWTRGFGAGQTALLWAVVP